MAKKALTFIVIIILFGSFLQIFHNVLQTLPKRDLVDFTVYRQAATIFLQNKNPYSFLYAKHISAGIPFNYPPASLPILSLLAMFPAKETQIVLTLLSFFSLWFSLWCVWKLSHIKISSLHFYVLLIFFVQTFPVKFTIILGQINLVLLAIICGSLFVLLHKKSNQATIVCSILFSIASGVKLFSLYTLPLFIMSKKFVFTAVVLFLLALSNLLFFDLSRQYYGLILPQFSHISFPNFYDQSVFALFFRLTNNASAAQILGGGLLLLLYALAFFSYYKTKYFIIPFSLVLAIASIGNFFSWQHHLVFAYPFIFLLYLQLVFDQKDIRKKFIRYCLFFVTWIFLFFHFTNESSPLLSIPLIASYQTVILLFLIGMQLCMVYRKK